MLRTGGGRHLVSCLATILVVTQVITGGAPCVAAAETEEATPPYGGSAEAWRLINAHAEYEEKKKNPLLAFGLELVLPGLGNMYAGEQTEAVLTWTGFLIGATFLVSGYGYICEWTSNESCSRNYFEIASGWMFLGGSWIFGLTSAPLNTHRNNRALRARLGLDDTISMAILPARIGDGHGLVFRLIH